MRADYAAKNAELRTIDHGDIPPLRVTEGDRASSAVTRLIEVGMSQEISSGATSRSGSPQCHAACVEPGDV
ncbi:hypothetical protein A5772_13610 [Mycolicibacter sinensis]|uniref:Uncharacterized protein n=1 Tax=Mycolicibacter sinensis (strain JDM601) TaxID=875328 RepID=A0A1A2E437_MYCSD|nr:hypothetical protein A5772_13610 [Mycolicibacter sinensis]OBG00916.1 hypothetical protein A5771_17775 [Mycolicibacter sinensis]